MAEAALQYAVTNAKIDSAVIGVTKPEELQQNVDALAVLASRDDLESIAAAGTIDEYFVGGPEFVWPFPEDRKQEFLPE